MFSLNSLCKSIFAWSWVSMFLVTNENMGLCLCIYEKTSTFLHFNHKTVAMYYQPNLMVCSITFFLFESQVFRSPLQWKFMKTVFTSNKCCCSFLPIFLCSLATDAVACFAHLSLFLFLTFMNETHFFVNVFTLSASFLRLQIFHCLKFKTLSFKLLIKFIII